MVPSTETSLKLLLNNPSSANTEQWHPRSGLEDLLAPCQTCLSSSAAPWLWDVSRMVQLGSHAAISASGGSAPKPVRFLFPLYCIVRSRSVIWACQPRGIICKKQEKLPSQNAEVPIFFSHSIDHICSCFRYTTWSCHNRKPWADSKFLCPILFPFCCLTVNLLPYYLQPYGHHFY